MVSVAAVKGGKDKRDVWFTDTERKLMNNKIHTILSIALANGHDSLVLSAFGCGAYGCPPNQVAHMFLEKLLSGDFCGKFKKVVFAIIEDHNSNGQNYRAFANVFNV